MKELLGSLQLNRIYQMDCLEGMKLIPDRSIDMILCDLPYGTTACKWDTVIPFDPLWKEYERIIKDNGAIVLTASQPFTSALVMSNPKLFKHEWIWNKNKGTNFMSVKREPLKVHESVLVFSKSKTIYNPQLRELSESGKKRNNRKRESVHHKKESVYGDTSHLKMPQYEGKEKGYPISIISINKEFNNQFKKQVFHPTQKPVALFEYLIKTYSNEGDVILDNCIGSGTTAVASTLHNRKWIGFETDSTYFELANKRLEQIELDTDISTL